MTWYISRNKRDNTLPKWENICFQVIEGPWFSFNYLWLWQSHLVLWCKHHLLAEDTHGHSFHDSWFIWTTVSFSCLLSAHEAPRGPRAPALPLVFLTLWTASLLPRFQAVWSGLASPPSPVPHPVPVLSPESPQDPTTSWCLPWSSLEQRASCPDSSWFTFSSTVCRPHSKQRKGVQS